LLFDELVNWRNQLFALLGFEMCCLHFRW